MKSIQFKITRAESIQILNLSIIWCILNIGLNLLGLLITWLIVRNASVLPQSLLKEIIFPLGFQAVLFFLFSSIAYPFFRHKKYRLYGYLIIQTLVFHLIFFSKLTFHGAPFFVSTFTSLPMKYMALSGQYLIDVLYQIIPLKGNYSNNMMMPLNTGKFYFHWVIMVSLYNFGLTFLALKVSSHLKNRAKTD